MKQNKELIEKVARAIYEAAPCGILDQFGDERPWDTLAEHRKIASRDEAQAAITALQSEQAGVNEELLEALKFYANDENYCEDCKVNFPFRDTPINFDRGRLAKQAISNAERYSTGKNEYKILPITSAESRQPDTRDEQIRILREGLADIAEHCGRAGFNSQTIAKVTLAAADKLNGGE